MRKNVTGKCDSIAKRDSAPERTGKRKRAGKKKGKAGCDPAKGIYMERVPPSVELA